MAKRFLNLAGNYVAAKTQESSGNHTTRLYGVQEAICIYRRDHDNTPGRAANNLNPVKEGAEFMFLTNAISLSRTTAPAKFAKHAV